MQSKHQCAKLHASIQETTTAALTILRICEWHDYYNLLDRSSSGSPSIMVCKVIILLLAMSDHPATATRQAGPQYWLLPCSSVPEIPHHGKLWLTLCAPPLGLWLNLDAQTKMNGVGLYFSVFVCHSLSMSCVTMDTRADRCLCISPSKHLALCQSSLHVWVTGIGMFEHTGERRGAMWNITQANSKT